MFQFQICYLSYLNVSLKKLIYISGAKPGTDLPAKCRMKDFILPHKYHATSFLPKILSYIDKLKM